MLTPSKESWNSINQAKETGPSLSLFQKENSIISFLLPSPIYFSLIPGVLDRSIMGKLLIAVFFKENRMINLELSKNALSKQCWVHWNWKIFSIYSKVGCGVFKQFWQNSLPEQKSTRTYFSEKYQLIWCWMSTSWRSSRLNTENIKAEYFTQVNGFHK